MAPRPNHPLSGERVPNKAPTSTPTPTVADREAKAKLRALAASTKGELGATDPFPRVPEYSGVGNAPSPAMAQATSTPTLPGMHALDVAALEAFPALPPSRAVFPPASVGHRGQSSVAVGGEITAVRHPVASPPAPSMPSAPGTTVAATVANAPSIRKPPTAPKGVCKPKKTGTARGSRHPASLRNLATLARAAITMADDGRAAKAKATEATTVAGVVAVATESNVNAGAAAAAAAPAAPTSSASWREAPAFSFDHQVARGGGVPSAEVKSIPARRRATLAAPATVASRRTPVAGAPRSGDGVMALPLPPPPARAVTAASPVGTMMSKAVLLGNRPVREDLARLERQVTVLCKEIFKLGEKIEVQGGASNKVAGAIERLEGKVDANSAKMEQGVAAAAVSAVAATQTDHDKAERITDEIATLDRVRTALREHHGSMIVGTNTSEQVLPGPPAALDAMLGVTMQTLDMTNDEAHDWLLHYVPKKVRLGKDGKLMRSGRERARTALLRVLPHLLQYLMRNLVGTFFKCIEVVPRELSPSTAARWRVDLAYGKSVLGRKAVMAMLVKTYELLGVSKHRVHRPTTAGSEVQIDSTVGLYGLMTTFARHWLDIAAGLRAVGRNGTAVTLYEEWRAELPRVDTYLATDNDVHGGLRLVDGKDVLRSFILQEVPTVDVEEVNDGTEADDEGGDEEGLDEEEA